MSNKLITRLAGMVFIMLVGVLPFDAMGFELKVEQVTSRVFAIVGEIGPRTAENHALNNTLGFVITDEGVVLVGSGATPAGAQLIEQAVARVTDKPIRLLVNIGVQDHHWMGNRFFADQGVSIKALKRTVDAQKHQLQAHLGRLRQQIGAEAETVVPAYADEVVRADRQSFSLGSVRFELIWPGEGHFAGDAVLWLPQTGTLFSGDFVFHDRLLGIHHTSAVAKWRDSFHKIAAMKPAHIIPGHGHAGDLDKAQRDTGDYLDWLTREVGRALEDWRELGDTVEQLGHAPGFSRLLFYDDWHKRNIHRTYMQFEADH